MSKRAEKSVFDQSDIGEDLLQELEEMEREEESEIIANFGFRSRRLREEDYFD